MTFKPNNYSTVSPYLIVADADSTIRFLQTVFGAKEIRRFADDAGRLMHAEVQLGDTVVMLADCSDEWPAMPSYVHVYVPDVDDVYRRAIAAGGISLQEPVKKEDDDKRGGVKDVGGTTWWIATKIT
jgi:PhnB protein